jgi:hypothetical protein
MGETKTDQITFRLEQQTFKETKEGADAEELKVADFSRKLHRSALLLYEHFGSLSELKRHAEKVASKKVQKGGAA